jgi:hypothetical protein
LRAWLKGSTEGRGILNEVVDALLEEKCRECQLALCRNQRVLVVLRRLGFRHGAEVYAENGVTVRMIELPDIPDDAEFVEGIEELVKLELPKTWQGIMDVPSRQVKSDVFRGITVEQALEFSRDREVILAIKQAGIER